MLCKNCICCTTTTLYPSEFLFSLQDSSSETRVPDASIECLIVVNRGLKSGFNLLSKISYSSPSRISDICSLKVTKEVVFSNTFTQSPSRISDICSLKVTKEVVFSNTFTHKRTLTNTGNVVSYHLPCAHNNCLNTFAVPTYQR